LANKAGNQNKLTSKVPYQELSNMKFSGVLPWTGTFAGLLLLPALLGSHTFANSVIAGGWVPEHRNFVVTPFYGEGYSRPDGAVEVAVIEIDNNLPDFELGLDFSDADGNGDLVAEVRLQGLDGTLGTGLDAPSETTLKPGPIPGRFIWDPGRQHTATIGYRVRVMVTYTTPIAEQPHMAVAMPPAF
jgi:hypothetical protein